MCVCVCLCGRGDIVSVANLLSWRRESAEARNFSKAIVSTLPFSTLSTLYIP